MDEALEKLIDAWTTLPRGRRIRLFEGFLEDSPALKEYELEAIADAILYEELTDKSPDKTTNAEYPFFSRTQLSLRDRRITTEVNPYAAATDGKTHDLPTRKKRSPSVLALMDERARIRNKERRQRYINETKPGEVVIRRNSSLGRLNCGA